eukprot:TRINITY_DN1911_c0_g1_i1.p1 TRINITY_DN1911_c0_g1~~TRINITY_DN1911_c0_g1_i1.p1  ORF type:complete len:168 (-),score=32.74 TRINITY_DN1911_c0_g1_i1:97-600(-)
MKYSLIVLALLVATASSATVKLSLSEKGLQAIASYEPYKAYFSVAPGGHRVIGYGHDCTVSGCNAVHAPLSRSQALAILKDDTAKHVACVNDAIKKQISQSQFDALVSFSFSLGCAQFKASPVPAAVNAGNVDLAKKAMNQYVTSSGKTIPGVVRRRAAEVAMLSKV